MSAAYAIGDFVWLKQEGYPWWPGIIVSPESVGQVIPEELGDDGLCIQCLPSSAPTVAFARRSDPTELQPFLGPESSPEEAERIKESLVHSECSLAVEEGLQLFSAAKSTAAEQKAASKANQEDAEDLLLLSINPDEMSEPQDSGKGTHKRHREHKDREKRREERRSRRHRHRKEAARSPSSSSNDSEEEEKPQKSSHHHSQSTDRNRRKRDEEMERLTDDDEPEDAAEQAKSLLEGKFRSSRHPASNEELRMLSSGIQECVNEYNETEGDKVGEEKLLYYLRSFAECDVTLSQLHTMGVGKAVGFLLRNDFPPRVRALAQAILTYWFHSLENIVQETLLDTNDVGNCSVDSTIGDNSDRGLEEENLKDRSSLWKQIYSYFTEEKETKEDEVVTQREASMKEQEEREEAIQNVCDAVETALARCAEMDVRISVLYRLAAEEALRCDLLAKRLTATEVVTQEEQIMMGCGSPLYKTYKEGFGSPLSASSPSTFSTTTLYPCPNCGMKDAYHTGYTVSAHDNFPTILQCRHCSETWNTTA